MSNNLKAGIRFNPNIYAEIGYDSQNETGEMSVIGANGETIWESEGGGGSSGFSLAQMTITGGSGRVTLTLPIATEPEDGNFDIVTKPQNFNSGDTPNIVIPTSGRTFGIIDASVDFDISGNIQYNAELGGFYITGNCTITLSDGEIG